MKVKPRAVFIVAHPDDETLLFGGAILHYSQTFDVTVVCVTDGNADGKGKERKKDFLNAIKILGARDYAWLGFPDIYSKRLGQVSLKAALEPFVNESKIIFSHGAIGEYGHPHHQDVSEAVHSLCSKVKKAVHSPAYNTFPDRVFHLSNSDFEKKCQILSRVYGSETQRFLHLLPVTSVEAFVETKSAAQFDEAKKIFRFMSYDSAKLSKTSLKRFKPLYQHLLRQRELMNERPF